ncbi:YegP family protein [Luteibacter jiangsuensis]|uniref:YegP family protein n=1 Tax=Luteibacter jiangsuensis TaxID=637577 RepID=UPI003D2F6A52
MDRGGRPYFVLKAANGEIVGTSESYSSSQAMEHGIAVVKTIAPNAPVVDES